MYFSGVDPDKVFVIPEPVDVELYENYEGDASVNDFFSNVSHLCR